jgi:DNA-binding XRE family transcriptional regulator
MVAEAVKLLALSNGDTRRPRTKYHNPAVRKDQIASAVGVSRKTIDRIDADRPELISELERLDNLSLELRKAYIDGISQAICERLREHDAIERQAQEQAMRRRIRQMLPPDK